MVILLMVIGDYYIHGYWLLSYHGSWWLFYSWLLLAILFMATGGYFIHGYW